MPISPIVLQRRHAELGRIRLGDKGDRGQPQKLNRFRFTSPSEAYVKDLAELYGGTPQPWDNNGVPGWEVYTTATSIPVYAVKGGLSQWLEFWQGGGCVHRCDGETNVLTGAPCDLTEKVKTRVRGQDVFVNPHTEAKPTTRLSVMLPELDAIGVWRMESHGWNAAAEIPAVAELAAHVGPYAPAVLHLVERRAVKDGKTSRFVVPVLDLRIGQARLREIVQSVSGGAELEAPKQEAPAIEAPKAAAAEPAAEVRIPTPEQIAAADLMKLRAMQDWLGRHGMQAHPAYLAIAARIDTLENQPDEDGAVDAELVDDATPPPTTGEPDPDYWWSKCLAAGGEKGMSLDQVTSDFREVMGLIPDEASGAEIQAYHTALTTGQVA